MADADAAAEGAAQKSSKLPFILGLGLAVAGGAGGFYAAWNDMLPGMSGSQADMAAEAGGDGISDIAFIEMQPITVSISGSGQASHLLFRATLEVPSKHRGEVEKLMPRVVDILNGYLRALRPSDIEGPASLARLRSQMLRRAQIVTGPGRINDLLVMEFIVN